MPQHWPSAYYVGRGNDLSVTLFIFSGQLFFLKKDGLGLYLKRRSLNRNGDVKVRQGLIYRWRIIVLRIDGPRWTWAMLKCVKSVRKKFCFEIDRLPNTNTFIYMMYIEVGIKKKKTLSRYMNPPAIIPFTET